MFIDKLMNKVKELQNPTIMGLIQSWNHPEVYPGKEPANLWKYPEGSFGQHSGVQ